MPETVCPWSGKRATNPNAETDRCPACDQDVEVVSGPMGGEYAGHRYRTPVEENHSGLCQRAHPGMRHGEWERRRRGVILDERGAVVLWHALVIAVILAAAVLGWRATHHDHARDVRTAAAPVNAPPTTIAANGAVLIPPLEITTSTAPPVKPRAAAPARTAPAAAQSPASTAAPRTPPTTAAPATTAAPRPASCAVSTASQQGRGTQQTFTVRAVNPPGRTATAALYAGNGSGGARWSQAGNLDGSNAWTGSYTVDATQTPGTTYTIRVALPRPDGSPAATCTASFTVT